MNKNDKRIDFSKWRFVDDSDEDDNVSDNENKRTKTLSKESKNSKTAARIEKETSNKRQKKEPHSSGSSRLLNNEMKTNEPTKTESEKAAKSDNGELIDLTQDAKKHKESGTRKGKKKDEITEELENLDSVLQAYEQIADSYGAYSKADFWEDINNLDKLGISAEDLEKNTNELTEAEAALKLGREQKAKNIRELTARVTRAKAALEIPEYTKDSKGHFRKRQIQRRVIKDQDISNIAVRAQESDKASDIEKDFFEKSGAKDVFGNAEAFNEVYKDVDTSDRIYYIGLHYFNKKGKLSYFAKNLLEQQIRKYNPRKDRIERIAARNKRNDDANAEPLISEHNGTIQCITCCKQIALQVHEVLSS